MKMTSKKELEKMRDEILESYLENLDEEQLRASIDGLTKSAFMYYLNNDEGSYKSALHTIKELALNFSPIYENIYDFINYSFLKSMNEVLSNFISRDFSLKTFHESKLALEPDEHAKLIYSDIYFDFYQKVIESETLHNAWSMVAWADIRTREHFEKELKKEQSKKR